MPNEYEVPLTGGLEIDFGATGTKEILQNVAMIISTVTHSCPMHRDFALDASVLDRPINVAQALLKSRIISAIRKYEPRAQVKSIKYQGSGPNGLLKPIVRVRING